MEVLTKKACEYFNIIGLPIINMNYQQILDYFQNKIENKQKSFCVTLNLDILRQTYYDENFRSVVKSADIVFADGMPLIWLSGFRKQPLKERIAGRKIVFDLCKISQEKGYKIFMFGAAKGVADLAKAKLENIMPGVQIVGTYSPDAHELTNPVENDELINKINASGAEILFVALGAPKQELWINNNLEKLNPYVYIPCGGSIDFIAGVQVKSPEWIGNIGFEWLFRLFCNPKRMFKRYIIHDLPFLFKMIMEINKEEPVDVPVVIKNIMMGMNIIKNTKVQEKTRN